jgi:hypothetical protein
MKLFGKKGKHMSDANEIATILSRIVNDHVFRKEFVDNRMQVINGLTMDPALRRALQDLDVDALTNDSSSVTAHFLTGAHIGRP